MESTPNEIDVTRIEKGLCEMHEVMAIHELHIWAIIVGKILLACHVKIKPDADADVVLDKMVDYLNREYNISNEGSSPCQESIGSELKAEAKFLKSCGALLETPVEIRKASGRVKAVLPHNEGSANTKFHSWLPTTSIENLHLEGQQNQFLVTPVKVSDSQGKESGSPGQEHTTSTFIASPYEKEEL
ncbi:hypothetical protein IFM89_023988 [Coptis chinensis]|uniref:Cation efflux protein cytoplasmic domain-containing protein n=1 Tax=Coptis chinensis TaxID=261450 RepID=A0A835HP22_9MAGN|nr:hypothetical protein IFM89_023988 [Coptis chinensis]